MSKTLFHLIARPAFRITGLLCLIPLLLIDTAISGPTENNQLVKKGVYLVAKRKLHGTSFQQAVILITHYSEKEVMGFTINRPTKLPLTQLFPDVGPLKQNTDLLFLGGPVHPKKIFVLVRTKKPNENMRHIIDDVYFSTVKDAFSQPSQNIARTFAGYSGWTARQLQSEIKQGDWQVLHTGADIIFEKNPKSLWQRLHKKWSGKWA